MFEHPDATSVWTTIRVQRGDLKTIMVVETNLTLNALAPDYDQARVDALCEAVRDYLAEHRHLDEAAIEPIGDDNA